MRAPKPHADQVLAALKKLTDLPIRYIIDTNADADFVGGNAKVAKAGQTIFTNLLGNVELSAMTNGGAAAILAHDSVLHQDERAPGKAACIPSMPGPRKPSIQSERPSA